MERDLLFIIIIIIVIVYIISHTMGINKYTQKKAQLNTTNPHKSTMTMSSPPSIPQQSVSSPICYGAETDDRQNSTIEGGNTKFTNLHAPQQQKQQRQQPIAANASDVFAYSNMEGPDVAVSYPEVGVSRVTSRTSSLGRLSQSSSRSSHIYCPTTGTHASYLGNTVKRLASPLTTASELIVAAQVANTKKYSGEFLDDDDSFANITEQQKEATRRSDGAAPRRRSVSFGGEEMTTNDKNESLLGAGKKDGDVNQQAESDTEMPSSCRNSTGDPTDSVHKGTLSEAPSYYSTTPVVRDGIPSVVPTDTNFSIPTFVEDTKITSFEMQAMNRWKGVYVFHNGKVQSQTPLFELVPPAPIDLKKSPFLMARLPRLVDPDIADEANSFAIGKKREMLGLVKTKEQRRLGEEKKKNENLADLNKRREEDKKTNQGGNSAPVEMREVDPAMMTDGPAIGGKIDPAKRRGSTGIISGTVKEHPRSGFDSNGHTASKGGFLSRIGKAYTKMKANLQGGPAANRFYLYFPELSHGIVGTAVAKMEEESASIAEFKAGESRSTERRNSASSASSFANNRSSSSLTGGRMRHRFSHDLLDLWVGEFECVSLHRNTAIEGFAVLTDKHLCFVSERGLTNNVSYFTATGQGVGGSGGGTGYQVRSVIPYTDILGIEECAKEPVSGVAVTMFSQEEEEEHVIDSSDGIKPENTGRRRSSSLGAVQTFSSWHDSVNNSAEDHSGKAQMLSGDQDASTSAFDGPNHGFEYANENGPFDEQNPTADSAIRSEAPKIDIFANNNVKDGNTDMNKKGKDTSSKVVLLPTGAPARPKSSTIKTTPLYFVPLAKRGPDSVPYCLQIYLRDGSLLQLFDFKSSSLFDKEPTQNYLFPPKRNSLSQETNILASVEDLASYTYFSPSASLAKLRAQVHYLNGVRPQRRVDDKSRELSREELRDLEEQEWNQLASTQKCKPLKSTSSTDPLYALQEFHFGKSRTQKPSSITIQISQPSRAGKSDDKKSNPLSLNSISENGTSIPQTTPPNMTADAAQEESLGTLVGYSCELERQTFHRKSTELDRFEALLEYYWRRELYLNCSS